MKLGSRELEDVWEQIDGKMAGNRRQNVARNVETFVMEKLSNLYCLSNVIW
jgi:hypothetical protein